MNFSNPLSTTGSSSASIIRQSNSSDSPNQAQALPSNPFPEEVLHINNNNGAPLSQRQSKEEAQSVPAYISQLPAEIQCHIFQYLSLEDAIETFYALDSEIRAINLSSEMKAQLLSARMRFLAAFCKGWAHFNSHQYQYIKELIQKVPGVCFQNLNSIALSPGDVATFKTLRQHFADSIPISLRDVCNLTSCASYDFLENVTRLDLKKISSLAGLEHFPHLKVLTIHNHKESCMQFQHEMPKLSELEIGFSRVEQIQGLNLLPQLSKLTLNDCDDIENLGAIEPSISLKELSLEQCSIQNLVGMAAFPSLERLKIVNCLAFRSLALIETEEEEQTEAVSPSFETLKALSIDNSDIEQLDGLEQFPGLTELALMNCANIEHLEGLQLCPNLTTLHIGGTYLNLQDMSALKACSQLKRLTLSSAQAYEHVFMAVLDACQQVQEVHLKDFWNDSVIKDLDSTLSQLPHLSKLTLEDCESFKELDKLKAKGVQIVLL